jgi:hypothetical protein
MEYQTFVVTTRKGKNSISDVEQDLHSYSKQPTAHSFFQSNFLVGKIMFHGERVPMILLQ